MKYIYFDIETLALQPNNGEMICIAVAKETPEGIHGTVFTTEDKSEKQVVDSFIDYMPDLSEDACIVTYNGDTFDWGFLVGRAMTFDDYGESVDKLFQYKEQFESHDIFKTHGKQDGSYLKLEDLCRRNGVKHRVDCDGGMIQSLYREGRWQKIRKYAQEDVRVTFRVFDELGLNNHSDTGAEVQDL